MNHSNWMIPGAHESWRSQLHYESKNIENHRVLFAGDDFEKICLLNIDENPLILLAFHWKTNDNQLVFIGFPIQIWPKKIPNILFFDNVFQNHLQQKLLDGFECFYIHSEAEIVRSHEHLESFNSSDSSLRYRTWTAANLKTARIVRNILILLSSKKNITILWLRY